jgi:diketogulonate reductase-like aldo/keto reductase
MPLVGLGTYAIENAGQEIARAITEIGYRTIDTAAIYQTEEVVGQGVKLAIESGKVTREDLFIITKVWVSDVEDCEAALKKSLGKLGLEQVDLYLVHWPQFSKVIKPATETEPAVHERINISIQKVWEQMEALVEKGLTKSIGVSNWNVQLLWDLLSYAKIKPVVNEIELNPYLVQEELVRFCFDN